jgi:rubrerythrin
MRRYLNICAEIEETVGRIYEIMAEKVGQDERLATLWRQMASDERDHAGQIRFALRLPVRHVFEDQDFPEEKVEVLLTRARNILQLVEERPLSVREALRLAHGLEGEFLCAHVVGAAFKDESLKKMMQALARADEAHLGLLSRYAREVLGEPDLASV